MQLSRTKYQGTFCTFPLYPSVLISYTPGCHLHWTLQLFAPLRTGSLQFLCTSPCLCLKFEMQKHIRVWYHNTAQHRCRFLARARKIQIPITARLKARIVWSFFFYFFYFFEESEVGLPFSPWRSATFCEARNYHEITGISCNSSDIRQLNRKYVRLDPIESNDVDSIEIF